jgi:hypothetical protein
MKKLLLLSAFLIFACSSDDEGNPCIYEPTLSTEAVTDITETSATLNGIIAVVSENCDVPNNAEQGFVYSSEIQPTTDDIQVNVNGTSISTTLEGLEANTTYYVRSFLTNALGEFYGNEVEFTTNSAENNCYFIPSTDPSTDILSYTFLGGTFDSYGCEPIDPTYWLSENADSVTVTFVNLMSNPSFRVWGMNDDDSAIVSVNGDSYPLNLTSASYDTKVVCGLSPGPDGVGFSEGKLVGVNSNTLGNFSYQNVQLFVTNVTSITVTGISGAGWGFAGVCVN